MECREIEDGHVIDRYIQGRLPAAEAEVFEDHYMECAQCQDALDAAAAMGRGYKRYAAEEASHAVEVAAVETPDINFSETQGGARAPSPAPVSIESRRRRWQPIVGSLAALLVLTVGVRWLAPSDATQGGGTSVVFLQVERSNGETPPSHHVRQPAPGEDLVLVLELEAPLFAEYQADLTRHGTSVWAVDHLSLGERETVSLNVTVDLLVPGDYQLDLTGTTIDGRTVAAGHFAFRVIADSD